MRFSEGKLPYPPLQAYPPGPASLQAAQTFYNAARHEITERCKFRDQVIIAVVGAIAAFVAYTDPARISKGADWLNAPPTAFDLGLSMRVVTVILGVMATFLARYLGYQNLKIAELGYFITSSPAYHFQLYSKHQLDSGAAVRTPDAVLLHPLVVKLNESLAHWDRWARGAERDKKIVKARQPFSLDSVVGFLIKSVSCTSLALLAVITLRIANHQRGQVVQMGIASWTGALLSRIGPIAFGVWIATGVLAVVAPLCTLKVLRDARRLKDIYAIRRDTHHDPTIDPTDGSSRFFDPLGHFVQNDRQADGTSE